MKTDKISVNKTTEAPEGVEIEIVQPESNLESNVLSFLLTGQLRDMKDRLTFDLPERFTIEHQSNGTFVVSAQTDQSEYYQPSRPIAIVGVQAMGPRFGVIHGKIGPAGTASSEPEPDLQADISGAAEAETANGRDTVLSGSN